MQFKLPVVKLMALEGAHQSVMDIVKRGLINTYKL
jgi:hypothetical protein